MKQKGIIVDLTIFCDSEQFRHHLLVAAFDKDNLPSTIIIEVDRQMGNYGQANTITQNSRNY